MASRGRFLVLVVLAAAALAGVLWLGWQAVQRIGNPVTSASETTVRASGLPVVMRTAGGTMEIATVKVYERFRRENTMAFWGIPLGTTTSLIQAPVTYRYHIPLAVEWPVEIRGNTAIVRAPAARPTLPVAFDTRELEAYSQSGWARFNRQENLDALMRSITPELQKRADDPAIRQLATEAGRQTVREFVTRWLLKEQPGWKRDQDHRVLVLFPGETPESLAAKGQ
jgi:hypothetical protein